MAGLLVLLILVAAGLVITRSARRSAALLTAALAGLLIVGCTPSYKSASDDPPTTAVADTPAARPPCPPTSRDPACEAERQNHLADLADAQIRTMPVLVRWRDQLPWGKQTPITAVIASADRAAAASALNAALRRDSRVEETSVAIGRRVRAELTGPNVEIDEPAQTVRDVTALQNVTFEWLVKPTRPGRTTLTLRVFNELITPDGPIELEHPALVHDMTVKIGLLDWLTWQMEQTRGLAWVIGGILAILGFLFANRAKLRRWWRRRHPPAPPAA